MATTRLLPFVSTGAELRAAASDVALWPPALNVIRKRHALPPLAIRPAARGSFPVFLFADEVVVKLVPERWRGKFDAERALLLAAHGRLAAPTPRVVAEGELDGWRYLVMTKLPGARLGEVWAEASAAERAHVARRIGELMASVHALPPEGLADLALDWPRFVEEQRATCAARHAAGGARPEWFADIAPYVEAVASELARAEPLVPMSADITDDHVLLERRAGKLDLSGFIDFGDALLGDPAYDFVTPVTFIVRGDALLMSALLDGYGCPPPSRTLELRRRFMAYALLHRFSDLRRDVDRLPSREALETLADVERAMWPF